MDSVPVPSAPSGYGGARDRRDDGPGERRTFNQPDWGSARADARGPPSGMGGGMGGGMGDRGASYGKKVRAMEDKEYVLMLCTRPTTIRSRGSTLPNEASVHRTSWQSRLQCYLR